MEKRKRRLRGSPPITKVESPVHLTLTTEVTNTPRAEKSVQPVNTQKRSRVTKLDATTVNVIAKSLNEMLTDLRTPTGTTRDEVGLRLIVQVASNLVRPSLKSMDESLVSAISIMAEMSPQNAAEAMLAGQMIAAHEAAMWFMSLATQEQQTFEGREANVLRATRLMRVFNEQLEAMQKLKGVSGQQKVMVEHVHVHRGGQAIVGTVEAPNGRHGGGGQ